MRNTVNETIEHSILKRSLSSFCHTENNYISMNIYCASISPKTRSVARKKLDNFSVVYKTTTF